MGVDMARSSGAPHAGHALAFVVSLQTEYIRPGTMKNSQRRHSIQKLPPSALARNYHRLLGKSDPAPRQVGSAFAAGQGLLPPSKSPANRSRSNSRLADRLNQRVP